jgi:nickel/cobalt transporter (NiCoT) family protein
MIWRRRSTTGFDFAALRHVLDDSSTDVRGRVLVMYAVLLAANVGAWILALEVFRNRPALIGAALLAYTFGLRHAVDADHIAAIDNVTRKLMQERKRPVGVGFFFSLGHSTIVVALTVAIALAATTIRHELPSFQVAGALVGTSISALFLYVIAAMNLIVLGQIFRALRAARRGQGEALQSLDDSLSQRGFLTRFCRPLFRMIGCSWHMYPLGVLFGLGFDTATEVGLLGIAAIEAGKGLPILSILIFPLLFTAGMSLIDTSDGILMLGAYGWAFVKPVRKLYYNLSITLVSVIVALLVGTIEALGLFAPHLGLEGRFWALLAKLNDNFGLIGFVIIGVFLASWGGFALIYKMRADAPSLQSRSELESNNLTTV